MAILAGLRALRVTVQVDGKTACEYEDPAEDKTSIYLLPFDYTLSGPRLGYDPHIVRYIEAEPGALLSFRISKQARFQHRSHHIAARISFGGQASLLQHETDQYTKAKGRKWRTTLSRIAAGPEFVDPEISVHYNGVHEIDSNFQVCLSEAVEQRVIAKHNGTVKVCLFHMNLGITRETGIQEDSFRDHYKRPFAMFEFRYRTREGLMEAGIEPRPIPTNIWHSIADEIDYLSDEEARDRLAVYMYLEKQSQHQAALNAEQHGRAKAEPGQPGEQPQPELKQEPQTPQQDGRARVKRERRARQPRIKQEPQSPPPLGRGTRADRAIKRERLRAARGVKRQPSGSD